MTRILLSLVSQIELCFISVGANVGNEDKITVASRVTNSPSRGSRVRVELRWGAAQDFAKDRTACAVLHGSSDTCAIHGACYVRVLLVGYRQKEAFDTVDDPEVVSKSLRPPCSSLLAESQSSEKVLLEPTSRRLTPSVGGR